MATRRKGGLPLEYSVELSMRVPLDARQLVRTKEELLDPDSYPYGYNGMIVGCRDEQKVYMLIDQNNATLEAAWKEIGTGDGTGDAEPIPNAEIDEIIFGANQP